MWKHFRRCLYSNSYNHECESCWCCPAEGTSFFVLHCLIVPNTLADNLKAMYVHEKAEYCWYNASYTYFSLHISTICFEWALTNDLKNVLLTIYCVSLWLLFTAQRNSIKGCKSLQQWKKKSIMSYLNTDAPMVPRAFIARWFRSPWLTYRTAAYKSNKIL